MFGYTLQMHSKFSMGSWNDKWNDKYKYKYIRYKNIKF